ncbi:hypothetical protein CGLAMM_10340 [Acetobacteraceae bacterium EV16G]|uniref:Thiocillin family RiPP n=1 Tax=Sorlinia euscelidii TaxID=3081148 RepID=A0ABU7U2X1_9PROT
MLSKPPSVSFESLCADDALTEILIDQELDRVVGGADCFGSVGTAGSAGSAGGTFGSVGTAGTFGSGASSMCMGGGDS